MAMNAKHFKKRDAILDYLRQSKAHPSAETIYTDLKPQIPDLAMGTVYRNLTLFKQKGLVSSVATVSGVERFDANTQPHVHFICSGCDAVIDLHDLMESPDDIRRKFKRAITDSDTENCVRYDPENKPGVANLMAIYSAVTGKSYETIEAEFAGQGYGSFKPVVGDAVIETLRPIREEASRLLKDKAYLESVYRNGAERASYVAEKTLRKVYKKVGFLAR